MPTFDEYEKAMIDSLKEIEGVRDVLELSEELTGSALQKVAPRDSGILLVPLGGMPSREQPETGQFAFECRTGAFIVTRNARGSVERTRAARVLAQYVMLKVHTNQWELPGVFGAVVERLENRSSGKADKAGYAIWLVLWKQTIYLDELPADSSVIPQHIFLGLSPLIGAGNEPFYSEVDAAP